MDRVGGSPIPLWKMRERRWLGVILLAALVHGLLYVALVPPWGHYDEMGHFEYAWLAANRPGWPKPGDYDRSLQEQILESMIQTGFFRRSGASPVDLAAIEPDKPLPIGIPQLSDPFFYYFLVSLPLQLMHDTPVTTQLLAGRLISLAFLLLTVGMAYGIVAELTPPGAALRWLVPSFLALLPGLVEFMTAFNNLSAAIGLVSVWLWLAIRLVRQGFSRGWQVWAELGGLLVLTWLSYNTQKTAWLTLLLLPLVLALAIIRRRRWILIPAGLVSGLILWQILFINDDAALWIRRNYQTEPTRLKQDWNISTGGIEAIAGKSGADQQQSAIQIRTIPVEQWNKEGRPLPDYDAGAYQIIPIEEGKKLEGKTATMGAWIWADHPTWASGPHINALCGVVEKWYGYPDTLWVTETPQFFAAHLLVPNENCRLQFWLPGTLPDSSEAMVYYTGLTLVRGFRPLNRLPVFTAPAGEKGRWDESFENFVRNPFAQETWPRMRPRVEGAVISKIEGLNPSTPQSILSLFLDPKGTTWYSAGTMRMMFRSFWASFGWGEIELAQNTALPVDAYVVLFGITLAGLAGSLVWLLRCRHDVPWAQVTLLLIAIAGSVLIAYGYGLYTMGGALRFKAYYPMARYIYPVVVPLAFFIVSGWEEIQYWIGRLVRLPAWFWMLLFFSFLILVNIHSLYTITSYYYPS